MTTPDNTVLGQVDSLLEALVDDDPIELYEHAPCGYMSTLADGTIVKVNATFLSWSGYRSDQVVGRRFHDLLVPGDRIFFETHYAPLLRMQGRVREIALDLVLADGSGLPVLVNAVLRAPTQGRPEIVRIVVFDAHERRAYERELLAAREHAERAERRARALAETLQATFLPPTELEIPGLEVAGAYRAAGAGDEVGGDFYDVFETGRGTHAVVLGDVSGKGAAAAVVTAFARYSVRAESLRSGSPAEVLRLVHRAMIRYQPDRFCTAALVEIDTRAHDVALTVALGGHAPPIRTNAVSAVPFGEPGTILGMIEISHITDTVGTLWPGESLVIYTDGVSEARRAGELFGDDRVAALAVEGAQSNAASVAEAIVDAALDFQDGFANDDMAVVVLKRTAASN